MATKLLDTTIRYTFQDGTTQDFIGRKCRFLSNSWRHAKEQAAKACVLRGETFDDSRIDGKSPDVPRSIAEINGLSYVIHRTEPSEGTPGTFYVYQRRRRRGTNFAHYRLAQTAITDDEVDGIVIGMMNQADGEQKSIEINVQWCRSDQVMPDKFDA